MFLKLSLANLIALPGLNFMRLIQSNRPYTPSTGLQGTTLHKGQGSLEEMADSQGAAGSTRDWNALFCQNEEGARRRTGIHQKDTKVSL